jgi:enoyl-CoA hydratase
MIDVSEIEGVAVVRLAHGKVNALDLELCRAISATFRGLGGAPAVVLTGTGSTFCAGVDLWRILDGGDGYIAEFIPALTDAFAAVFTCDKPVVAAVNGHAIAGGCVFTCCCDYRIMTTGRGGIGIPELLVGVPFPATALSIMEQATGRARQLAFGGKVYPAPEALAQGLIDELAEPETLVTYAVSHAARLASTIPAGTFRLTKRHLNRLPEEPEYDAAVVRMWQERAADGWIADYLARTIRR